MHVSKQKELCPICGRQISRINLTKHLRSHKTHPEYQARLANNHQIQRISLNCIYCGKLCKSKNSLTQHECRCKENPNHYIIKNRPRPETFTFKGRIKSPESLQKQKETFTRNKLAGLHKDTSGLNNNVYKPGVIEKIRRTALHNIQIGKVIPICHSRSKYGWYKGFWCDSSWELAYVIYNIDHNIPFERNTDKFSYFFEGQPHIYIPDFKLANGDYIEIKGYITEKDKAKIEFFPKDKKLIFLYSSDLQYIFSYVTKTYGKDFVRLYE